MGEPLPKPSGVVLAFDVAADGYNAKRENGASRLQSEMRRWSADGYNTKRDASGFAAATLN